MSEYKKMVNKTLSIYVFRHGQTTYNRDGRFTGFDNPNLTSLGQKQARIIAKKLKNKKFNIAFHTSLKRSRETLKEILVYHPECQIILEDDRMIERNYGKLNGSTHSEFIKKMGKKIYNLEVQGDLIHDLSEEGKKEVKKFLGEQEYNLIHRGYNIAPPGGESFAMVESRVKLFIKDLKKIMKKNQSNVAISAHGNSIRLLRKIMESLSKEETCELVIPYDNFYEYKIKV